MGNYLLQKAMAAAWTRKNQPLLVSLINQLLMVAADVDNDLFDAGAPDNSDGSAVANLTYRITALYLIYFLLFQKNILTKALSEITSNDGGKYLRKIVQVELDVPVASEKQMRTILEGLDKIIDFQNVKVKWDRRYWQSIFLDDLWPHFTTLRDIKLN